MTSAFVVGALVLVDSVQVGGQGRAGCDGLAAVGGIEVGGVVFLATGAVAGWLGKGGVGTWRGHAGVFHHGDGVAHLAVGVESKVLD